MMIRRFAGEDGKLSELQKLTLTIGKRRRAPKGILFIDDFYADNFGNFDDELLTPVEQKFARFYPLIADEAKPVPLSGEGGAALIDWIAAMLARTRAHAVFSQTVAQKKGSVGGALWQLFPSVLTNIARIQWFSECQDLLSRPMMRWKIKTFCNADIVVLTDHPVCQTNGLGVGGQVTIVPLSKHRVLFGGQQEAVDQCNFRIEELNTFLAGYAERSVFATNSNSLEIVVHNLRGEGPIGTPEWCANARRPFFGFSDRVKEWPLQTDLDTFDWWERTKDSYGETVLPTRRSASRQHAATE